MRKSIVGSKILVTGGAGFIGSTLVDKLIMGGAAEVVAVDNLFCGGEENLDFAIEKGAYFYKDDIENDKVLDYIFDKHKIDIVFNCATKALNYSFINPANAFDTNTTIALNLLDKQRRGAFSTLCHFSTSEVYGTALYEPMDESHPKNPTTTYAAGKAAADLAVESFVRMFDLDAFIVRPFNNYGPKQNYRGILAAVIPLTVLRIHKGEPPEIQGTGNQSRDFILVDDTVNAIIGSYPLIPKGDSVNISTDCQITINQLIEKIAFMMDYNGPILRKPERKADVFCHNASNKKIKSLIDFPLTPFDDGLRKTIDWYINEFNQRDL